MDACVVGRTSSAWVQDRPGGWGTALGRTKASKLDLGSNLLGVASGGGAFPAVHRVSLPETLPAINIKKRMGHPGRAARAKVSLVQGNTVYLLSAPRPMTLLDFQRPAPFPRLRVPLPLVSARVCAGFPSPADDHLEGAFDLNELLVKNPPATFLVRVSGESMAGVEAPQIANGDLLVVDRAAEAKDGSVVVACLDGEFTVKRLRRAKGRVWLQPANREFPEIAVGPGQELVIWGVVTARVSQFQ